MQLTTVKEYLKAIKNGPISQPDTNTCQATCIHAVTGGTIPIATIRSTLESMGIPGDPAVMAEYLRSHFGNRYELCMAASINDMRNFIRAGEVLIGHGWLTDYGHVIVIDGVTDRAFRVMDPWEEFNAVSWEYIGSVAAFHGLYSDRLIHAAFVDGDNCDHASYIYNDGIIDRSMKAAWIHRIKPETM